ncbi:eukaryotic translation initiation factor 5B isoform X2 [Medicago truncatula]|uniref:Translation initiation factor n=1 Tax=Medicago truncatula TaxID=3880 RepID=A0A072U2Y2_MEDTR|nr:eukaryotic translation initiation factor 5B isoform X2 [Medicago truncatula]KEH24049.1 translation initiation factor [Medicago truncatula]
MENPSLLGEGEGYVSDVDEAIENISVPKKVEKKHLRSPICLMIGHELSGKTALLDCIRGTKSDNNDFQHYRATYVPAKNIRERTRKLKSYEKIKVPGLLFIDTPGFISIPSLKYRGLALCDIAILVVDINIGLRPQTIETLNLLNMCKTKFIVVLNQVDRIYGWKTCRNASFPNAYMKQSRDAEIGFCSMLNRTIWQFRQHGIVTKICYQNKEMRETVSIVPTSAISGEGISDMLLQLVMWTQKTMVEKLTYREELQCIILDVNDFEDCGTTLNVVLVNGVLHEGDQIAVCGRQGTTIVTSIQALLKTPPLMELGAKICGLISGRLYPLQKSQRCEGHQDHCSGTSRCCCWL